MSGNAQEKNTGSDFGFDDALDQAASEFSDWTPEAPQNDQAPVDKEAINQAAEAVGFTSREPKPAAPEKEPSDQVSIRGRKSVIDDFKAFCKAQEPEWPQGYALERAMQALKRELGQG